MNPTILPSAMSYFSLSPAASCLHHAGRRFEFRVFSPRRDYLPKFELRRNRFTPFASALERIKKKKHPSLPGN